MVFHVVANIGIWLYDAHEYLPTIIFITVPWWPFIPTSFIKIPCFKKYSSNENKCDECCDLQEKTTMYVQCAVIYSVITK